MAIAKNKMNVLIAKLLLGSRNPCWKLYIAYISKRAIDGVLYNIDDEDTWNPVTKMSVIFFESHMNNYILIEPG